MIDWGEIDSYKRSELRDIVVEAGTVIEDYLARIRIGVYDERRDGNLLEVLEEIERILR